MILLAVYKCCLLHHESSFAVTADVCRFFKESSEEERGHAEKLMEYQVTLLNHFYFHFFFLLLTIILCF